MTTAVIARPDIAFVVLPKALDSLVFVIAAPSTDRVWCMVYDNLCYNPYKGGVLFAFMLFYCNPSRAGGVTHDPLWYHQIVYVAKNRKLRRTVTPKVWNGILDIRMLGWRTRSSFVS